MTYKTRAYLSFCSIMYVCILIHRTSHIVSWPFTILLLGEIGHQLVKAPLAAAMMPIRTYLISPTHSTHAWIDETRDRPRRRELRALLFSTMMGANPSQGHPQHWIHWYPFIHLGICFDHEKMQCQPHLGLEPRPLDLKFSLYSWQTNVSKTFRFYGMHKLQKFLKYKTKIMFGIPWPLQGCQ